MKGLLLYTAIAMAGLVACDQSADQKMKAGEKLGTGQEVSFATVEEQRAQGRANAGQAAAEYQRQNPRIQGWETIVKADTQHSSKCPQGSGWAEVVFMRSTRTEGSTKNLEIEKATVMCSTVSATEGCVMVSPTDNWSKHPKKGMASVCASTHEVPFPLPKVAGAR